MASHSLALPSQPDERDLPTLSVPAVSITPTKAMLVAAVRSAVVAPPSPPQWLFQPAPVAPARTFHFQFSASTDTNVVSYDLQAAPEINGNYWAVTNVTTTNITYIGKEWHQFFRVVSVNVDGLNSEGYYSK